MDSDALPDWPNFQSAARDYYAEADVAESLAEQWRREALRLRTLARQCERMALPSNRNPASSPNPPDPESQP